MEKITNLNLGHAVIRMFGFRHRRQRSFRPHLSATRCYALAVISLLLSFAASSVQAGCSGPGTRYLDKVCGETPHLVSNMVYGQAFDEFNSQQTIDLKLDRYSPFEDSETNRPVIIWAHGGGLISGDKADNDFLMQEWARRGYVTASINYRLCPTCTLGSAPVAAHENAKHDMQMAVRYVRDNAASWGIDPNRIVAAGFSAGATMTYSVTYDAANDNDPGTTSSAVAAGIMHAPGGIYIPETAELFHVVDPGEPPAAIFIGANDYPGPTGGTGAGYGAALNVHENILSQGVPAELSFYPLGNHDLTQHNNHKTISYRQDFLQRSSDFLYRRLPLNASITPSTPQAFISRTDMRFATNINGNPDPPAKTITITNVGGGTLNWNASNIPSGVTVTPTSGSNLQHGESTTVSIRVHPSACLGGPLCEGVTWPVPRYPEQPLLTINTPGAAVTTHTIAIHLKTTDLPAIQLRERITDFATNSSGLPTPPAKVVTVENVGGGTLNWSASESEPWISLINGTGASLGPGQLGSFQVSVTPSSETSCRLPGVEQTCGPYNVWVGAFGASSMRTDVGVQYFDRPRIATSPTEMHHFLPANGQVGTTSQSFILRNMWGGTLTWQASHNCGAGMTIIPSSGSLASNATQSVEVRNIWNPGTTVGAYGKCLVTISDNGSSPGAVWPSATVAAWGVATD